MRVVHVQRVSGIGGSERHLLTLLPALAALGHEIHMVVLGNGGSDGFLSDIAARDVRVHQLKMPRHVAPVLLVRLRRLVERTDPDLVHTHLIDADVYGQLATRSLGLPAVSSFHSTNPFFTAQPYRTVTRLVGRIPRITIAISEHVQRFLVRHGFARPSRIRVIPYGINSEQLLNRSHSSFDRAEFGCTGEDFVVGVASRLFPKKGQDLLIEAFQELHKDHPHARLLIAGEGVERRRLERLAEPTGDRIRFLGHVHEIGPFLSMCDVVVFPTQPGFGEGFGLAALEAMACGTPVIATAIDSLPEVIDDGISGFLVPPEDVASLADALRRVAGSEDLRGRMSKAAAERAKRSFGVDQMVSRTIDAYGEALSTHRFDR